MLFSSLIRSVARVFSRGGALVIVMLAGCSADDEGFKESVFVVSENIESIELQADNNVLGVQESQQYSAYATVTGFSEMIDVSDEVRWQSFSPFIADINGKGVVTGIGVGTVVISAELADLKADTILTISDAELTNITITSDAEEIPVCTSQTQLTATGFYTDNTERNITDTVSWSADDELTITINDEGSITSETAGSVSVSASLDGVEANILSLEVLDSLSSIIVSPSSLTIDEGVSQQFTATGEYTDGIQRDIGDLSQWRVSGVDSDDNDVASISDDEGSKGILTSENSGDAVVTVSCGSASGLANVTVTGEATVSSLSINEGVSSVEISLDGSTEQTEQLTLEATFSDGTTEDATESAAWFYYETVSGEPVTVSSESGSRGLITATEVGETLIKVNYGDITE